MSERIGFVGLGIMGKGMARNLLKAGFDLRVWNRTSNKAKELEGEGAKAGSSPSDVAAHSDITVVCVSDTPDVEAVVLGDEGIIHGARSGSLVIDCSTISPQRTKEIGKKLNEKGIGLLDAPISGGSEGAAKGTLSIMVGGKKEDFDRAQACFQAMGKSITHVGPQGAGQMVKLVNQILVAYGMVALGEALVFAQAGGLDLETTVKAIQGGAADSWTWSNRGPQAIKRDWRPGFMIDLQQKDLRLVLEAADSLGVPVLGSATAFNLYRTLQARGLGSEGNHAMVKAIEAMAGIEIGQKDG